MRWQRAATGGGGTGVGSSCSAESTTEPGRNTPYRTGGVGTAAARRQAEEFGPCSELSIDTYVSDMKNAANTYQKSSMGPCVARQHNLSRHLSHSARNVWCHCRIAAIALLPSSTTRGSTHHAARERQGAAEARCDVCRMTQSLFAATWPCSCGAGGRGGGNGHPCLG